MAVTITKKIREYIDVDFAFVKHPVTSNLAIKKDINAVKQSVMNLLRLQAGDKPFHPEIKSPIFAYLFENMSVVTKVIIEDEVRRYLNIYEPRLEIIEVTVSFPNSNGIECTITGSLINLSDPFTINVLINRLR